MIYLSTVQAEGLPLELYKTNYYEPIYQKIALERRVFHLSKYNKNKQNYEKGMYLIANLSQSFNDYTDYWVSKF